MSVKGSTVNFVDNEKDGSGDTAEQTVLKTTRSITTLLAHIMVGVIVTAGFLYGLSSGTPSRKTMHHIILCVVGFQFLIVEAILALAPDSWLSTLKLRHQRLIHFVMQVLGSVLALTGCFIKILDKDVHWDTLHGQFALVAMVFTTVSLVNGITSFFANGLRKVLPGTLSKITHICFGAVAVFSANISLIYGFDKQGFRNWASPLADTIIITLAILTVIILINPMLTFYNRSRGALRK